MPAKALCTCLAIALLAGSAGAPEASQQTVQLLRGATVVDGTGEPGFVGDVLIRDGLIAAVGRTGEVAAPAGAAVEDLAGLVLAPGFVDIHNHSTDRIFGDPLATTQIAQGVTTIVVGADGSSPWPIARYLERLDGAGLGLQVATFVGHGTVRGMVLGDDFRRAATQEELRTMSRRLAEAMDDGAFGLSSGLEYDPGFYSETDELIALAGVVGARGGLYMSHLRDEEEGLLDAVAEAIRIGDEADLPVQISHVKAGNASVWGRSADVLTAIAAARERGVDIMADQYPYAAWQSGLGIIVRSRKFQDPGEVADGLAQAGGGLRLQIIGYEQDPGVNGQRLDAIATQWGVSEVDAYMRIMANGGSSVIGHTMSDEDVDRFMTSALVMTASDGGVGSAHPRGAGAFAKILGHYVRERGLLSLEQAVRRGTAMPAARLGLDDRGLIRAGRRADLVAFDPETIAARSTFRYSLRRAVGVHKTWVDGVVVFADNDATGAAPGGALRHAQER